MFFTVQLTLLAPPPTTEEGGKTTRTFDYPQRKKYTCNEVWFQGGFLLIRGLGVEQKCTIAIPANKIAGEVLIHKVED